MDTTAGTSRPLGLVVDDEPQMRYVITFALETQGFRCVSAADAESAWELLSEESFDLVVLDVMLPGLGESQAWRPARTTTSPSPSRRANSPCEPAPSCAAPLRGRATSYPTER